MSTLSCGTDTVLASPDSVRVEAEIINRRGLHARAAAKFVKTVEQFSAEITVSNRGQSVSGRSIMGLMMLAAGPGTTIALEANGPDADRALEALCALVADRFHEGD
ncbi:HPr family phosphocarrier protein [Pararhodospirillum photometricum]|uniref:HPrNtr n=1 Tax=Pararhodospirillum photometricum DSM 122 TaxID=1150469 RepID=H6SNN6_PARPM|nr:HPr family phosphocarrier protein [Pararhodospirillum photometricum]CCG09367.1 HPrNtr [Pararhodospirillum photometricum DSM 122]